MISTLPLIAFLVAFFAFSTPVHAIQTVPYKMNFQGRLADATGTPKADGTYNIIFRIYNSANTAVWTESHLVSNTQGVTVTGGLFTVQLGSITALSPSLFNSATANQSGMTLEVELPTPATATSSSPSWTEGAMTPRNPISTSAYSFNSDTIDGIDSADLGQLGTTNSWTNTNSFSGAVTLTQNSTSALTVQNSSNAAVLTVDTSNLRVIVGSLTNGIALSDTGIIYSGTARPSNTITLSPEYAGATFTPDGTANLGTLTSDFCSGSSRININTAACSATATHNYYQWTTTEASNQDYDIYVRYQMPSDYDTGSMTNLLIWGWGTSTTTEVATVALYTDTVAAACSTSSNAVTANGAWNTAVVALPLGSCTINAGDLVTFRVRVQAGQSKIVRAGEIQFTYKRKS